jgi:hypothetical protein
MTAPWRTQNEILAFGTEGLRRMRSALAPDWSKGWRLLPNLFCPVVEFSGETEACRRATAAGGAALNMFCGTRAGRRCSMSAAAVILPFVWATEWLEVVPQRPAKVSREPVPLEMAFYRKYTEGMLNRYVRLSMEAGRVSSLLGQEMFRGRVTTCRVDSFDDVVIFVHDVERCLAKLDEEQQRLIARMALQQYTISETAELMGLKPRTVVRRYCQAVDSLTRIFLSVQMLELQECCQGGKTLDYGLSQ